MQEMWKFILHKVNVLSNSLGFKDSIKNNDF